MITRSIVIALVSIFFFSLSVIADDEKTETAFTVKAVTFNVRFATESDGENQWNNRRALVAEVLRQLDADVIGFQEVLASQLAELVEMGPYAAEGVARDDGREKGEFSPLLFSKDKYVRLQGGTFWLSDTPHVIASNTWEAACNRVCSWVELADPKTNRRFAVYNAHFDHKNAGARVRSMSVIARQIAARGHNKIPLVLIGDFNCSPGSPPIKLITTGEAGYQGETFTSPITLVNTLTLDDPAQGRTFHGWKGGTQGKQIDYVLTHPDVEVIDSGIVRTHRGKQYPSDHYPVTATLRFQPTTP